MRCREPPRSISASSVKRASGPKSLKPNAIPPHVLQPRQAGHGLINRGVADSGPSRDSVT
jgi:hypothetical protein